MGRSSGIAVSLLFLSSCQAAAPDPLDDQLRNQRFEALEKRMSAVEAQNAAAKNLIASLANRDLARSKDAKPAPVVGLVDSLEKGRSERRLDALEQDKYLRDQASVR